MIALAREEALRLGHDNPNPIKHRPVCVYVRVSSHEQKKKGDLERQKNRMIEYCVKNGYKLEYILEDVGSGLSESRPKLLRLFNLVKEQKISKVVIEHKDRLTRFQFNVFEEEQYRTRDEFIDFFKNKLIESNKRRIEDAQKKLDLIVQGKYSVPKTIYKDQEFDFNILNQINAEQESKIKTL